MCECVYIYNVCAGFSLAERVAGVLLKVVGEGTCGLKKSSFYVKILFLSIDKGYFCIIHKFILKPVLADVKIVTT